MESSVGERDERFKRPCRVGLIFLLPAALALTVMLIAGCSSGGDLGTRVVAGDRHGKVEAGLQRYFSTFFPEDSIFPSGAGPPRVKGNGCKDLHRKFRPLPGSLRMSNGEQTVAVWQCFVRFEHFTLTVQVGMNDNNKVVWAMPVYGDPRKAPKLSPARTYTG